jgi:peptide/nickel transport system permease protein
MIGAAPAVFWVALAVRAPLLPIGTPNAQDCVAIGYPGSSLRHPLGRDVLSRIIWGVVFTAYVVAAPWVCWRAIIGAGSIS